MTTGIPGLDQLIEGGLPIGGVFLVQGAPGAGKTIFANQMCFHHGRTGGQAVFLTLLAESHARMFAHLRRFEFFDEAAIGTSVHYHAGFGVLAAKGLAGLEELTRSAVLETKATLIVVDGLVNASNLATSEIDFKVVLHRMQLIATNLGCTIVLLSSARDGDWSLPEHTLVDGVLELSHAVSGLRKRRRLELHKMRGVAAVTGQHSVEITDAGITVRQRLESRQRSGASGTEHAPVGARVAFGVGALDGMLHDGLPGASSTVLAGPTGAGKTTLGLQYVTGGVSANESGLYVGFYERPAALREKSRRLGLGLEAAMEAGLVDVVWEQPIEGIVDAVADRLLERVVKTGVKRLCVDGFSALRRTVDQPERIHNVTAALTEELERLGVTTVYTLETAEVLGALRNLPLDDMSAVTHNIVLLEHVLMRGRLHRLLTILKMRDSAADRCTREFEIGQGGILLADTAESARVLLSSSAEP